MMRFQVFLSLWIVTSCFCIDKIPEVAKTKVSKPKRYSVLKLWLGHASFTHVPTCLRHCVGRFAKHSLNVYAKNEGGTIILAVELLLPLAPCPGDLEFCCESEITLFWLPKEDTTRSVLKLCLQHCSRTVQHKYSDVCAVHFTEY